MPGITKREIELKENCLQTILDLLKLKVGEVYVFELKDQDIKFRRIE